MLCVSGYYVHVSASGQEKGDEKKNKRKNVQGAFGGPENCVLSSPLHSVVCTSHLGYSNP